MIQEDFSQTKFNDLTEREYLKSFGTEDIIIASDNTWRGQLLKLIYEHYKEFDIVSTQVAENYFPDYLKSKFDSYIRFFDSVLYPFISKIGLSVPDTRIEDKAKENILSLSNSLIKIVELYYSGDIFNATYSLNNLVDNTFGYASDVHKQSSFILSSVHPRTQFYRARAKDNGLWLRHEMFHVPFEKRHLVSTNRYSIPGIPALYASSDAFTCWAELGNPDLKDLNYVRLENIEPMKILKIMRVHDLRHEIYDPLDMRELLEVAFNSGVTIDYDPIKVIDDVHKIINYISLFPLILACSTKVLNANGAFKPEYIISQLLIQKLQNGSVVDGIRYPSTKVNSFGIGRATRFHNYVFPVKKNQISGLCSDLTKNFRITDATSLRNEKKPDNSRKKGLNTRDLLLNLYPIEVSLKKKLTMLI